MGVFSPGAKKYISRRNTRARDELGAVKAGESERGGTVRRMSNRRAVDADVDSQGGVGGARGRRRRTLDDDETLRLVEG